MATRELRPLGLMMNTNLHRDFSVWVVWVSITLSLSTGCGTKEDSPTKLEPKMEGRSDVQVDSAKITLVGKANPVGAGLDQDGKPEGSVTLSFKGETFHLRTPGQLGWFPGQQAAEREVRALADADAVVADVLATRHGESVRFSGKVRVRSQTDPQKGTAVVEGKALRAEVDDGTEKKPGWVVENGTASIRVTGNVDVENLKASSRIRASGTLSSGKMVNWFCMRTRSSRSRSSGCVV